MVVRALLLICATVFFEAAFLQAQHCGTVRTGKQTVAFGGR